MTFNQERLNSKEERVNSEEVKRNPFQELMYGLRDEGVRVSTSEWLDLQKLLDAGVINSVDELYVSARTILVKDATDYSIYDRVFGKLFLGLEVLEEIEEEKIKEKEDEFVQKEKEDIKEVAPAGSETSEDMHGGREATKDIKGSPNPAECGEEGRKEKLNSARRKIEKRSFENLRGIGL